MENFLQLCAQRQSCRDFLPQRIEHEKLLKCIEAARLTPSACNSQPWKFVVVESPDKVAQVAKCTQVLGANAYTSTAQSFIVVLEEHATLLPKLREIIDSQYFAKGDLGAVTATICYEAQSQGLGSCILGLFDREKLAKILGLPNEQRFFLVVALGYPTNPQTRPKSRKSIEEIADFI